LKDKFKFNFVVSFLCYCVISLIGLFGVVLAFSIGMTGLLYTLIPLSAILYIISGRKLKLLDKHILNYLSVSSSFIFLFILISIELVFPNELADILIGISVSGWCLLVASYGRVTSEYYLVAFLPSFFMWVGMVWNIWKSKKPHDAVSKNSNPMIKDDQAD